MKNHLIPPWKPGHTAPSSRPGWVRRPFVPTARKRRWWMVLLGVRKH